MVQITSQGLIPNESKCFEPNEERKMVSWVPGHSTFALPSSLAQSFPGASSRLNSGLNSGPELGFVKVEVLDLAKFSWRSLLFDGKTREAQTLPFQLASPHLQRKPQLSRLFIFNGCKKHHRDQEQYFLSMAITDMKSVVTPAAKHYFHSAEERGRLYFKGHF